jgi:hypothetical protein
MIHRKPCDNLCHLPVKNFKAGELPEEYFWPENIDGLEQKQIEMGYIRR